MLFESPNRGRVLISLIAICTIGSVVEFSWASGEAVLVPYLSKHGVRQWMVSTVYLANPVSITYDNVLLIVCCEPLYISYVCIFVDLSYFLNDLLCSVSVSKMYQ